MTPAEGGGGAGNRQSPDGPMPLIPGMGFRHRLDR
jgi:hypothetical protein